MVLIFSTIQRASAHGYDHERDCECGRGYGCDRDHVSVREHEHPDDVAYCSLQGFCSQVLDFHVRTSHPPCYPFVASYHNITCQN